MTPVIQSLAVVERPPSQGGAKTLARFTVDLDGVRIFGLLLRELPDGSRRTVAPNLGGQHVATFRRLGKARIDALASDALERGEIVRVAARGEKTAKWLDVPTGLFAAGLGTFTAGMPR